MFEKLMKKFGYVAEVKIDEAESAANHAAARERLALEAKHMAAEDERALVEDALRSRLAATPSQINHRLQVLRAESGRFV